MQLDLAKVAHISWPELTSRKFAVGAKRTRTWWIAHHSKLLWIKQCNQSSDDDCVAKLMCCVPVLSYQILSQTKVHKTNYRSRNINWLLEKIVWKSDRKLASTKSYAQLQFQMRSLFAYCDRISSQIIYTKATTLWMQPPIRPGGNLLSNSSSHLEATRRVLLLISESNIFRVLVRIDAANSIHDTIR